MGNVFAQGHRDASETIRSEDDAIAYADAHSSVSAIFLCDDFNRIQLGDQSDTLKPGDLVSNRHYEMRIIALQEKEIYRFKIISLTTTQDENAAERIDDMYRQSQAGKTFNEVYHDNMPIPPKTELELGDAGWLDADFYPEPFQSAVKAGKKKDVFVVHDTVRGWHNLVFVTHAPKKAKGFFVLLYPQAEAGSLPIPKVNHANNIELIVASEELIMYGKKYPDEVRLELINASSEPYRYSEIAKVKGNRAVDAPVYYDDSEFRYRWIKDTTVMLYSFQYVYLNGETLSKEERNTAIQDIYKRFNDGVPFDTIVKDYWPDNKGMSTLSAMDGALLDPDFVAKLDETNVGELFVARVSQSYFVGVPLTAPQEVNAFLVLGFPY